MIEILKKEMLRKELKERNFYEGVTFVKEEVEKEISEWIFYLKQKKIELNKFTDLFCEWEEITLPIRIEQYYITSYSIDLGIIDSEGKEYYFTTNQGKFRTIEYYTIGKRREIQNKKLDRHCHYKIEDKNRIVLKESYADLINEYNKIQGCKSAIYYHKDNVTATATVERYDRRVKIVYRARNSHSDNLITNYLLNAKESYYAKDITLMCKDLMGILGGVKEVISIEAVKLEGEEGEEAKSFKQGKLYAKICVEGEDVIDYSPRKINI